MMRTSEFQKLIYDFFEKNHRTFPWRETQNPYEIMVSEIMLQQTQTLRVIPKYLDWLKKFPTTKKLANASLSEILLAWNGLGYNRRGKFLWEAGKYIESELQGRIPATFIELRKLPGIGEYTANAILAFAYNQSTIVVETNIRTVVLHHFFKDSVEKIRDQQIKTVLAKVIDKTDPRSWYYALMDYGNWLKSEGIDYFHKQKSYTKQKPFKGSERFVRGYLLRETLLLKKLDTTKVILPGYTQKNIKKVAQDLIREGLLKERSTDILTVV
ncbi:A/G-specific adenine glycosylase [bacterium]|nr:A/G-specific adenine glycosylase [bacterium]